jgi:hypothetical protein
MATFSLRRFFQLSFIPAQWLSPLVLDSATAERSHIASISPRHLSCYCGDANDEFRLISALKAG